MTELTHYESVVERFLMPMRLKYRKGIAIARANKLSFQDFLKNELAKALTSNPLDMSHAVTALTQELMREYLEKKSVYSFQDILEGSDAATLLNMFGTILTTLGVAQTQVSAEVSLSGMMQFHAVSYELAGKRTYDVTPGLGEQLMDTELRGVMTEDLRLPYEAIYIVVPSRTGLRVFNEISGWHRCIGLYIAEDPAMHEVDISGTWKEKGSVRGWRVMAVGEDKKQLMDHGDDAIVYFRVPLPSEQSLDDILNWTVRDFTKAEAAFQDYAKLTGLREMGEEWKRIFNWAMNVVLYVTHIEPGENWMMNLEARRLWERIQKLPKKSGKREKLKQRFSGMQPRYRLVLGSKITVKRGQPEGKQGESGIKRKVLHVKTRVAGHWRRVAHGRGRELRRWQWIQPYWKFKDGIELSKDHEVK